jgi:hypothetical protein
VAQWTEHVKGLGEGLLMNEIDSWITGVNRNVEVKQTRKIMRYSGGHPAFANTDLIVRRPACLRCSGVAPHSRTPFDAAIISPPRGWTCPFGEYMRYSQLMNCIT